jgi:hypothetical protein
VAAARSGETQEKGGVARLRMRFPEVDRSSLKKKKKPSKNFKKD